MVGSATSGVASPYMSKSPSGSVVSNGGQQRSATTMVGSPKSIKSAGRKVSSPSGSRKGKGRRPSLSAYSDGAASSLSVNGGGSEYYSGGESEGARSRISRTSRRSRAAGSGNESDTEDESSDDGTTDSSDDDDGMLDSLSIDQDEIPVTGFAVASNKRNADFHELFPTVPEADYLIEGELLHLFRERLLI